VLDRTRGRQSAGRLPHRARRSARLLVRAIKNALNADAPRSISTALFPRRSHLCAKARSFRCGVHAVKSVAMMPALRCCSSDRLAKISQGTAIPATLSGCAGRLSQRFNIKSARGSAIGAAHSCTAVLAGASSWPASDSFLRSMQQLARWRRKVGGQ
jgi:hypothetical protein